MGVSVSAILDGWDTGVRPRGPQVSIGEGPGEAVDDIPFVRKLRLGAGNGGYTDKTPLKVTVQRPAMVGPWITYGKIDCIPPRTCTW